MEFVLLVPWILVSEFRDMLAVECVWDEWGIIMRKEGLCSLFLFLVLVLVCSRGIGGQLSRRRRRRKGICASGLRIVAMVLSSFARCNCVLFRYLEFGGRLFCRNGCEVLETLCIHGLFDL